MKTNFLRLVRIGSATFIVSAMLAFILAGSLATMRSAQLTAPAPVLTTTANPFAGFQAPSAAELFSR